ncbi:MAG: leucine-rich repeat protein [Clostridia bacterium]|nr:leucine-rich repeat protein [Clostridia bacterium]
MKALKRILALLMAVALLTGSVAVYAEQPESAGDIVEEAPIAAGLTEADVPEAGLLELAGGDDDPEAGEPDADPDDAPAETADGAADDGESEPEDADAPEIVAGDVPAAADGDAVNDEGADEPEDADAPEIVAGDAPEAADGGAVDDEGAGAPADADAPAGDGPSDPAAGDGDAPDEDEDAPGGDADGADETEDGDEQTDGVGATLTAFVDDADADWDGTATLQVRCEYTGAGELSYRWQRLDENDEAATWTDLPDGTEDSLYIADAATEAGVAFRCVVTDGELTAASEAAHVFAAPPMLAGDIKYSGTWGSLSWTLDADGVLSISGSGAMDGFTYNSMSAWLRYYSSIKSVVIGQGVTSIGAYAFNNCRDLASVEIPSSVTSIGGCAFRECDSLTSVEIPSSVTSMGGGVFESCRSLTSVTIPSSVTDILNRTFYFCSKLTNVTIPEGVTNIGESAFAYCKSLTSVTIPSSVTSIGDSAFSWCSSLTSVTISEGVTSIQRHAFAFCSSLADVKIPASMTRISHGAFRDCANLASVHIPSLEAWLAITFGDNEANPCYFSHNLFIAGSEVVSIEIPEGVTSIGKYAFIGLIGLKTVILPDSLQNIGTMAFWECDAITDLLIPKGTEIEDTYGNGKTLSGHVTVYVNSPAHEYCKRYKVSHEILTAKRVEVDPKAVKLNPGDTLALGYTYAPVRAEPAITFSTSNKKVATVNAEGVIIAKKAGTAKITVKADKVSAICAVTVCALPKTVVLTSPRTQLSVGDSVQTVCTFNKGTYAEVSYASSDEAALTVDGHGVVTAAGVGEAEITATTSNGLSSTLAFTVAAPPTGAWILPGEASILKGGRVTLTAGPADGYSPMTYISGDTLIATVDANGVVKGVGGGRTTITATTYNGKAAVCELTVREVRLGAESATLAVGDEVLLDPVQLPDAEDVWQIQSSNKKVAKVYQGEDGQWRAKGVKAGKATLTAISTAGIKGRLNVTVKKAAKKFTVVAPFTMGVGESREVTAKSNTCAYASVDDVEVDNGSGEVLEYSYPYLTAINAGTARIRAKAYNGKWTPWVTVNVLEAPDDGHMGIALSYDMGSGWYDRSDPEEMSVIKVAKGDYANARLEYDEGYGGGYTVHSSDERVLKVTGKKISFVGLGQADVICTAYNGEAVRQRFKVQPAPKKAYIADPGNISKRTSKLLECSFDGYEYDYMHMKFTSGKKSVASIKYDCCAFGKKPGKAKITLKTFNGVKATRTVRVVKNKITVAGKPSKADISNLEGDSLIYLKSLELVSSSKLIAEFYAVNGTDHDIVKQRNWTSFIYCAFYYRESHEIAKKEFKKIKFTKKPKGRSYGTFKLTFNPRNFHVAEYEWLGLNFDELDLIALNKLAFFDGGCCIF